MKPRLRSFPPDYWRRHQPALMNHLTSCAFACRRSEQTARLPRTPSGDSYVRPGEKQAHVRPATAEVSASFGRVSRTVAH